LVAGCLLVLIAHYTLNPTFASSDAVLTSTLQDVINLQTQLSNLTAQFPSGAQVNTSLIQSGLSDLQGNIQSFTNDLNNVNIGRFVVVWVACGLAILTSILGCVYVQANRACLFEWFCVCAIILVLGSCTTIAVMSVITNVAGDCCNELYYQEGLLELFQAVLTRHIASVDNDYINPQINNDTYYACSSLQQNLCPQICCSSTCGSCDSNNLPTFLNRTISDTGGVLRTVSDCSTQCTDPNLKDNTKVVVDNTFYIEFWISFEQFIASMLYPFTNPGLNLEIRGWVCDISLPVFNIYAGCGLFIGGACIVALLCLLLRGPKAASKR